MLAYALGPELTLHVASGEFYSRSTQYGGPALFVLQQRVLGPNPAGSRDIDFMAGYVMTLHRCQTSEHAKKIYIHKPQHNNFFGKRPPKKVHQQNAGNILHFVFEKSKLLLLSTSVSFRKSCYRIVAMAFL